MSLSSHPLPEVAGFFDPKTCSVQYVVSCPRTRKCAIIDPVLDYDWRSGSISTASADTILNYVGAKNLQVEWILDTHPHADHFSAVAYLRERTGAPTGTGSGVREICSIWSGIYNQPDIAGSWTVWDRLFGAGDSFEIGSMPVRVLLSPGHTLGSITYLVADAAFIHDTLFMPDVGTARADFPGGSASALWGSIHDILALPDTTRTFTGHDYRPAGRAPRWESTVADQRENNIHLRGRVDEAAFVAFRQARDRTLPLPDIMLLALQVNLRGGQLPDAEGNGVRYLRMPLQKFPDAGWR